jgi:hypothetical protein
MSDDSITAEAASLQREPEGERLRGLLNSRQSVKSILTGLADLIHLTEDEQKDAGIDLDYQY